MHVFEHLEADEGLTFAGVDIAVSAVAPVVAIDYVLDECRLTGPRHPGDGDQCTERHVDVEHPQIVGSSAQDADVRPVRQLFGNREVTAFATIARNMLPCLRGGSLPQTPGRHGSFGGEDLVERALCDHASAELASTGAEVDDVIRTPDDGPVVLDHQNRVSPLGESPEQADEALAVPRVQPDGGLVEHVKRAREAGAECGCEMNSLRLPAGKRARLTIERQVVETDAVEELDPRLELFQKMATALLLRRAPVAVHEPASQLLDAQSRQLRQALASHPNRCRFGTQSGALTCGTWIVRAVARQQHPHMHLVGSLFEPGEERFQILETPLAAPDPLAIRCVQVLPGDLEVYTPVETGCFELVVELRISRAVPRRDRPLENALRWVRDDAAAVDTDDPPESLTLGASPQWRVERKESGHRQGDFPSTRHTAQTRAEERPACLPDRNRLAGAQVVGILQTALKAAAHLGARTEPPEQDLELGAPAWPVLSGVQRGADTRVEIVGKPLANELRKSFSTVSAGRRDASRDLEPLPDGAAHEVLGSLLGREAARGPMSLRARHLSEMGIEETEDIVGLGDRANGRSCVAYRISRLDRDGG